MIHAVVHQLYERAHEYANLANRAGAIAPDLLRSCEEFYMPIPELHTVARRSKRKGRSTSVSPSTHLIIHNPIQSIHHQILTRFLSLLELNDTKGAALLDTVIPPPKSRSRSPDLLDSDDEGTIPAVPPTLRTLPPHFPSLPPKHTYMKTPVSPPKKAALPSLEKKLKTAGLVQKSLQNLLTATEENTNNEDAELLGHIVNWETGLHPRKRWKVGRK